MVVGKRMKRRFKNSSSVVRSPWLLSNLELASIHGTSPLFVYRETQARKVTHLQTTITDFEGGFRSLLAEGVTQKPGNHRRGKNRTQRPNRRSNVGCRSKTEEEEKERQSEKTQRMADGRDRVGSAGSSALPGGHNPQSHETRQCLWRLLTLLTTPERPSKIKNQKSQITRQRTGRPRMVEDGAILTDWVGLVQRCRGNQRDQQPRHSSCPNIDYWVGAYRGLP